MDCRLKVGGVDVSSVEERLVAYHFGTVDDDVRDAIEEHLLGCAKCLRAYMRLKRELDRKGALKPGAHVRQRLRAEVMATFKPKTISPLRAWLAQPISRGRGIAAGVALAIAAAITVAVVPLTKRNDAPAPVQVTQVGGARVDSARPSAESTRLY